MSFRDAVKLILTKNRSGDAKIYLRPIKRTVTIRRGTTDLQCLEKVFLADEYHSPFQLSPRLIVDGGANVGMATLFFAHQYAHARIVAIEPEHDNFQILKKNCGNLPNVTLIQAALWSQRDATLDIHSRDAEAWAFWGGREIALDSQASTAISTITGPELLSRFDAEQIDLLKLDIEGSERDLFSKGTEEWLDRIQIIAIELHDRYLEGCAQAFYSALMARKFVQEIREARISSQNLTPAKGTGARASRLDRRESS